MTNPLKKLFEPIEIGGVEIKNRIKLPPLGMGYCIHMRVTDRLKNFYKEQAKGGAGMIGISCSPTRLEGNSPFPGIYHDEFIPQLRELVNICHGQGAKSFCQIGAGYGWAFGAGPVEWVSPSGITVFGRTRPAMSLGLSPTGSQPRGLTVSEISQMVQAMGEAARRAREAGFDGVDIIASTGYTVSQFLSPLTNKRTDRYGGSLENRMRIYHEIVDSIREKAGEDYPILFTVSPQHTPGGYSLEELKAFASSLEKAGVKGFCTRTGWHDDRVEMLQTTVPQGYWVWIAEELKKVVKVPVSTGGRISDPNVAERIIAEGKADLVYMARALIADPELPNKAREGRLHEIRPCIGCMRCFEQIGSPVSCSVNAWVGTDGPYTMGPTKEIKKVFIIGGGPAGMEAARITAQRGHQVTLCEKNDRLGGQLLEASLPPYKEDIHELTQYLISQVEKSRVEIRINHEANLKSIHESNPDVVIMATGAKPIIPDLPGVERENVVTALNVLAGKEAVGEKVVIVGGGMVGCETAEFLAERGKEVTIVEMSNRIGSDIGPATRGATLSRLEKGGVRLEINVKVEAVTDEGVRGNKEGLPLFFRGDSVVMAVGMRSAQELATELEGKVFSLYLVGDCLKPRRIMEAIGEGHKIGLEI